MTTIVEQLAGLLVDVSIKAALLAVLAGAVLVILRIRSSNVRHRVWTAVLAAMLLLPLLVEFTPAVPLPAGTYPAWQVQRGDEMNARERGQSHFASQTSQHWDGPQAAVEQAKPQVEVERIPADDQAFTATVETDSETGGVPAWLVALVAAYAIGAAVFVGRLLVAMVRARALVRAGRPVSLPPAEACSTGRTAVLQSPGIRVPVTVGWRRPVILLPGDWPLWSVSMLAAVLRHEQTHVARGDHWVTLLAELNRAVYWFHPVAWFLRRRLATLAEEACDDAVIESLGDRTGYARHLLEVAGRLSHQPRRLQPAGVAMARTPQVEHRINAILDARRPLARRLGLAGALALVAVAVPLVLLAAGLRAGEGTAAPATAIAEAKNDGPKTASDGQRVSSDGVEAERTAGTLELTVLDDDGRPVAGANVTERIRQVSMGPWKVTNKRADEAGRATLHVPAVKPNYFAANIETPGYAPFFAEWDPDEGDSIPAAYTVHLDPGRLVGGIVENEEGEPIRGVKVRPDFQLKLRPERTHQLNSGKEVTTDAQGRWMYASLPADLSQLTVALRHPDYLAERVTEPVAKFAIPPGGSPTGVMVMKPGLAVVGRVTDAQGQPLAKAQVRYVPDDGRGEATVRTDQDGKYRLASGRAGESFFTASAGGWAPAMRSVRVEPGMGSVDFQLVRGKPLSMHVTDPDGAAITGATVWLRSWQGNGIYGDLPGSTGTTDANGIWQWPHAPEGTLRFDVSMPGFATVRDREFTAGEAATVTLRPESPQAAKLLTVTGRVTDAETKEPIARFRVGVGDQRKKDGAIYWYSTLESEGRDGQFRRELTPSELAMDYACVLKVEADGYRPAVSRPISKQARSVTVDFPLQPAAGAEWQVLTPDGQPAKGATVAVATPRLGPLVQDGTVIPEATCDRTKTDAAGRFSIAPPKGVFALLILHASGAAYVTQDQLARSQPIRLEPWGRVEGQLRIGDKPAAHEQISLERSEPPEQGVPQWSYNYRTSTDNAGRFAFRQVVPGKVLVVRTVTVKEPRGMGAWVPTHTTATEVAPGQTVRVDLSRQGRPVVAKLVMPQEAVSRYGTVEVKTKLPAEVTTGYDWRLAMVNLRTAPRDLPTPPTVPLPKNIDPQDRAAAMQWYRQWQTTEEGKRYQEEMKRYAAAVRGFRPVEMGSTNVEPDGTIRFADIPAGGYQLTVSARSPAAEGEFVPGRVIASLSYTFTVPEMPGGNSAEALELGELTLTAVPQRGR